MEFEDIVAMEGEQYLPSYIVLNLFLSMELVGSS
jgi:hypothetical protein